MPPTIVGLFVGLLLGIVWAVEGFSGFLLTAALGAVGFLVGKVIAGQLDLTPYLGGSKR